MTEPGRVLLALVSYASDRGKPAILKVSPQIVSLLCAGGLIERRADGYWITDLGRSAVHLQGSLAQHLPSIETSLA